MLTGNTTVPYRYDGGFGKAAPSAPITLLNNSTGGRVNHVKAKRQTRGGEAEDAGLSLIMSQIKFYYYPGQGRKRMKRSANPPSGDPAQHNTHHRAE